MIRSTPKSAWLAVLLLAASAGSAMAEAGKHLTLVHYVPPRTGWAMESYDTYSMTRFGCLETLAKYDGDSKLVPGLAESWSQSSDTTWDFKLRQGIKFQDGAPFNAEAVVNSLNHVLKAQTPSRAIGPKNVSSVEVLDEFTIRVTTPQPSQLLPYRLSVPSSGILSPAAYKETINPFGTCTGPFTFVSEVPKQSLKIVRNDNYWGEKAKLESVEVRFVVDAGTRMAQLRSGEADLVLEVPPALTSTLKSNPDTVIAAEPIPRTQSIVFNHERKPFDNVLVRRAIQSAIDVSAISEGVYEGYAQPAAGPFAPGQPWRAELQPAIYDLEKAKALFAEAGVDPSTLILDMPVYNDRTDLPDIAQVIQQQLQALGITIKLRVANYSGIEGGLLEGKFDLTLFSRNPLTDLADPSAYLIADFSCGGSHNFSRYCNPEVDKAIMAATNAKTTEERHAGYREIATKLQDEAVSVFVVHTKQVDAHSVRVKNYKADILGYKLLTSQTDIE